jgi:DNA repair exonuclease SbcCD nuclease subunit
MIIPYFTDNHISGMNSENRIGNYYTDSLEKLEEILQIAKANNSPFIICGGDLIDSAIISTIICDAIIDMAEKYGIIIYTLVGNHPMINHLWEASKATTMAHIFRRTKFIQKLDIIEGKDYLIKGYDYKKDVEAEIRNTQLKLGKSTKKWAIAVVHAFLTAKPFLPMVMHIPVSELDSDYDVVLCAHYHQPFKKIVKDTTYINPGCIGRTSIDEADIKSSILLLDTEKRDFEVVHLKTAKPKEEVFDLKKVADKKEFENKIDNFISSLETTQFTDLDLMGIAKKICKDGKVDKEVEDEVITRITTDEKRI